MIEKEPNIMEGLWNLLIKIVIPATIAISIKVATQIKKEKMTFTRVIMSFIIGIGCAYFIYPFVENHAENKYMPLLVGVVAMSGEKIAEYIIYKWDIDTLISSFLKAFFGGYIDKFKGNNKK